LFTSSLKGEDRSSVLPPDRYARRLRAEMLEVLLQFDLNLDYALFRERQVCKRRRRRRRRGKSSRSFLPIY
jgi:hypothetical protein